MKPRHVYRPPRPNRATSTFIIFGGGALLTFMVFYFIPLMQKLEQGMKKEEPDLIANIQVEEQEEYVEPVIEEKEEEPPPPEMDQAASDVPIDVPDLPNLTGGTGRVILNITPKVRLSGAAGMDTGGVDSEPTVSSKVNPSISAAVNRLIARKGGVRVVVSALVDENGRVVEADVTDSSGIPAADEAVLNAVRRYKFRPAIRGGRKAKARVKVPFDLRVR